MSFKKKSKTKFWSGGGSYGYGFSDGKSYALFQTEMSGTTAVFGRDKGISVSFGGDKIEVKENNVNFPALDMSTYLDSSTLKLCRGFVDAESAKFRFSERELSGSIKASTEKQNPLLYNLFRAVEDVRVEDSYIKEYIGAKKNLNETADQGSKNFLKSNKINWRQEVPMGNIAPMAIASQARKNMDYFGFGLGDIVSSVPKDEQDNVKRWAEDALDCTSTDDSWKLAQKIFDEIKEGGHDIPPPANGEKKKDGEGEEVFSFKFYPEIGELVEGELKESGSRYNPCSGKDAPYFPFSTKFDRVHHWSEPMPSKIEMDMAYCPDIFFSHIRMKNNASITEYMKMAEKLGPVINVARRKLELMLMSQRRTEWEYQKDRGKLDSRRMAAVVAGDWNVFKTREKEPSMDTAVTLMIDLSGSMFQNNKRKVATEAAIVLSECLAKIGIPYEIIGFDCVRAARDEEGMKVIYGANGHKYSKKYSRLEPLQTYVFKSFKDRFFDARPYTMGLSDYKGNHCSVGGNNNSDGESLEIAHQRLLMRPEQKKIMLVLSDGQPYCESYSESQQINYLKKIVKDIENKGTEIIGIGICSSAVKDYYSNYVVCRQASDLAGTVLKELSAVLLPKKKKAAG